MEVHSDISQAKNAFNRFFKDDLYGRFDSSENIILSRGAWKDETVVLPNFFKYCINHTLDNNWVGYSDSLGHKNTFATLLDWVNIDVEQPYTSQNCAQTLGNVSTIGLVFDQMKEKYPDASVLTLQPYYAPILKSISKHFPVHTIASLRSEEELLKAIENECEENPKIRLLLLSNFIGVEGRIFSKSFWEKIIELSEDRDLHTIIDEGLWFDKLEYPGGINNDRTIRIVSPSKKYGNPGMKIGYMLAPQAFIQRYYDQASTSFGGPPSIMFLASEFLYAFEYSAATENQDNLLPLAQRYGMDVIVVQSLFHDFQKTLGFNRETYIGNRREFVTWLNQNTDIIRESHTFDGINFLIEPETDLSMYDLFLSLIETKKVSIFPGICMGNMSDKICRVTILEKQSEIREGLARISDFLRDQ